MDSGMDMAERETEDAQMKEYKIGEVAKLLGLTTQALRFYEQEGVVMPRKTESGTRMYSVNQMVLLLSFKKYRQAEFTVQDIVEHFREDTVDSLINRLDAQSNLLVDKANLLLRRAESIRRFEQMLRLAQENFGRIIPCERPPLYQLNLSLDQLDQADAAQRTSLNAFIDAMPDTGIVFSCRADNPHTLQFRFCASEEMARIWSLPLEHAQFLPPVKSVCLYVRGDGYPWNERPLADILSRVRAAGYEIDQTHDIFGMHLASETIHSSVHLCGIVYVPVISH